MKRSKDRILTTFAGNLASPNDLLTMMAAKEAGQLYDSTAYEARVKSAVAESVRLQADCSVDIICDGEQGKASFFGYVGERLTGFEVGDGPPMSQSRGTRENRDFSEFYDWYATKREPAIAASFVMTCTGPIAYQNQAALQQQLDTLKAALTGVKAEEVFAPSISPTNIEGPRANAYYKSDEEYEAIVDAGFLLQVDDPRMITHYITRPDDSLADIHKWVVVRIAALNHALRGIPANKVRFHTCYSMNMGPRTHDMALKDIIDLLFTINAEGISYEAGNPRHDHEWQVFKDVKLPSDKVLIPGVISHTTTLVEHPELIADRLTRYASVVGRENVIAGSNCGFSSQATLEPEIHPTVVVAKLKAMAEGAALASKQLWGSFPWNCIARNLGLAN